MKLVFCIPSLENAGGTERILTSKVNTLIELGYDVYIVLTEEQSKPPYFQIHSDVKIINLSINFNDNKNGNIIKRVFIYFRKSLQYKHELTKLLFSIRPDITTSLLSHEVDFLAKIKDGSKKVAECHFNKDFREYFVKSNTNNKLHLFIAKIRNKQLQRAIKQMDHLVVLTQSDKKAWLPIMSRVSIIPNFLSFISQDKSLCVSRNIVMLGRYSAEKGGDILISIWKLIEDKYPDWHLYIYGDGPSRLMWSELIKHNKITNIHLEYPVNDVIGVLLNASFLVFPSRFEGFGLAIIEAMECGLPVIAFDCPCGPSDIITDSYDGYLIPAFDKEMFQQRILDLIENDYIRMRMGRNAIITAAKYHVDSIIKLWDQLYQSLVRIP